MATCHSGSCNFRVLLLRFAATPCPWVNTPRLQVASNVGSQGSDLEQLERSKEFARSDLKDKKSVSGEGERMEGCARKTSDRETKGTAMRRDRLVSEGNLSNLHCRTTDVIVKFFRKIDQRSTRDIVSMILARNIHRDKWTPHCKQIKTSRN